MHIPRFWSKVASTAEKPNGQSVPFVCWRGSPTSVAEAQALAQQAAQRMAARIASGQGFPERYAYPGRQVREEIVEEIKSPLGDVAAAVTRNAYGSLVLNAARVLFIDIDLPDSSEQA